MPKVSFIVGLSIETEHGRALLRLTRPSAIIMMPAIAARTMPSDSELLAARLARLKALAESLESACSQSADQRTTFAKLKAEMDAARAALEPVKR